MTPTASLPAGRLERYRIGLGMLSSLLAGRALYRLVNLATTVLLLPIWGEERYGTYAAAMATLSWVVALVVIGPEKAVLKFVPRAPRTGPMVSRALLAVVWLLPAPLVSGFVVALGLAAGAPATLYLGVAAMLVSLGGTLLLVGLHRVAGRPRADSVTFAVMSVAQLGLFGVAATGNLAPTGYVAAMTAVQLAINLGLSTRLGRPSLEIRHRPRFVARLGWTAVLMASTDLYLYLMTAALFAILAGSAHAGQIGRLYVLTLVWSAGVTMLLYVFRVYAPRISLRLVGRAGSAGRGRAAQVAAWVAVYNAGWLAVAGSVVALGDLASVGSPTHQLLVWVVLLATRAPAVAGMLWAGYLLENTDATAPRVVGSAAIAGLVVAVAAGLPAVPAVGAVGVILSIAAGDTAYAVFIARGALRRGSRHLTT